jgi:hypothetical protein
MLLDDSTLGRDCGNAGARARRVIGQARNDSKGFRQMRDGPDVRLLDRGRIRAGAMEQGQATGTPPLSSDEPVISSI